MCMVATFLTWIGEGVANRSRKAGLGMVCCFYAVCMPVGTVVQWINKKAGHGAIEEDLSGHISCPAPQTPLGEGSGWSGQHGFWCIDGATNWTGSYPKADLIKIQGKDPHIGKILMCLRESKQNPRGDKVAAEI